MGLVNTFTSIALALARLLALALVHSMAPALSPPSRWGALSFLLPVCGAERN